MCDQINLIPSEQVNFEFDIDFLTKNVEEEVTQVSNQSSQSQHDSQLIPFSLTSQLFSKIQTTSHNNNNSDSNSLYDMSQQQQQASEIEMEQQGQTTANEQQQSLEWLGSTQRQEEIGQSAKVFSSRININQEIVFQTTPESETEQQQQQEEQSNDINININMDNIVQALTEYNQNKNNPTQQSIQELEFQLWELQQNQIYNEKNGLNKSIYKKIKTNVVGSSSQCCSICFQNFEKGEKIKKLPCKHIFHINCIKPWLKKNSQCPNCRYDLVKHFQSQTPQQQQQKEQQQQCLHQTTSNQQEE